MRRGTLRIYLGYAAGVGKTFAMLGEGIRRRERGTDVVVGFVETHGARRPRSEWRSRDRAAPSDRVREATFEEMDVDAVVARAPEVVLVDELAHTNVPGSRNEKRWQDVDESSTRGSTSSPPEHAAPRVVERRRRAHHRREAARDDPRRGGACRRPDGARRHDPFALRRRMAHGNIYPPSRSTPRSRTTSAKATSSRCANWRCCGWPTGSTRRSQDYMHDHKSTGPWETRERVLVGVIGRAEDEPLIRRAARMATRRGGELLAVHVIPRGRPGEGRRRSRRRASSSRWSAATFHEVVGATSPEAARLRRAENVHAGGAGGEPPRPLAAAACGRSVINRVIRDSGRSTSMSSRRPRRRRTSRCACGSAGAAALRRALGAGSR